MESVKRRPKRAVSEPLQPFAVGALCALHSDPNRAAELGRKGGARNRKVYDNDSCNVYVPESVQDVSCLRSQGEPAPNLHQNHNNYIVISSLAASLTV